MLSGMISLSSVRIVAHSIQRHIHGKKTQESKGQSADATTVTAQINTIHQVTAMLATSKHVLFPGHNHLLATGTDDPTL